MLNYITLQCTSFTGGYVHHYVKCRAVEQALLKKPKEILSVFNNISKKIKILSYVCTIVGILCSFIFGFVLLKSKNYMGIAVIILGSFISWVASFTLYGFGQLIENTDIIANRRSTTTADTNEDVVPRDRKAEKMLADRITVITTLKDDGLISEEEYQSKMESLRNEK